MTTQTPHSVPSTDAPRDDYERLHREFRWHVPQDFNIAEACCGRWARDPAGASRVAVLHEREDGRRSSITYGELQAQANRLSHALKRLGARRGDRIAIVMPQRIETAVAQIAVQQIGAVAMPLSMLFGPDALAYRLHNSEARLAIADESGIDNLLAARPECHALATVLAVGEARGRGDVDWEAALARESAVFVREAAHADDAAILIYTSGTTGPPKGALMPHRALLGNLPGFTCSHDVFPQPGDVFWSPADWAWTGGLMDALLPTLYHGYPLVGQQGRFDPERAFALMQKHRVRSTFLFPTALKMMMKAVPRPLDHFNLALRSVMSAGEAVGGTVFEWTREALGVTVNEMFGQTEINYIVGNSHTLWPAKPGSIGRPYPGHRVALLDDEGNEVPVGEPGDISAWDEHDPVFFLEYWKRPEATRDKYSGRWCRTGDMAVRDEEGYLWYRGRSDDMFKSAGYRIGPAEIENCLVKHPAVANAAVVPSPDTTRGNVVKAFIVLTPGHTASEELAAAIQEHVRARLAPYEYPKLIEFIDALPMTTTGKVQRKVLKQREAERVAGK